MLPRATHTRGDREAARGKQSGRTQEIQRLIGRALRAVVDRTAMGEVTVTLDCDVLNADGGHALCCHYRRLGRTEPCLPSHAADERDQDIAADWPGRGHFLRHLRRRAGPRSRLCRGIPPPMPMPISC